MKNSIIYGLIPLFLFLVGCGPTEKTTEDKNNNPQSTILSGKLELGPISGATIEFKLLDGTIIDSTISNSTGKFTIDISKLEKTLVSSGYTRDTPFYIYGENGIDTDPNDDGNIVDSESIDLNGYVKGIVTINSLMGKQNITINLLSTFIADSVIKDENEDFSLITARSKIILEKYHFKDINNDGRMDMDDVYEYDMHKDNEHFEATLRIDYLNELHSGNTKRLNEIETELNEEINLNIVFQTINTTNDYALLKLKTSDHLIAKVERECKTSSNYKSFFHNEDTIKLFKDCTIIYQNCINENNCSKETNVLSYDFKTENVNPYVPYVLEGKSKELKDNIIMSKKGYIIDNVKLKRDLISVLNDSINKKFSKEEKINALCKVYENYDLDCPR